MKIRHVPMVTRIFQFLKNREEKYYLVYQDGEKNKISPNQDDILNIYLLNKTDFLEQGDLYKFVNMFNDVV